MKTISHKTLLNEVWRAAGDDIPEFRLHFPMPIIGGLSMLESAILIGLVRLTDTKQFFEFGTYLGTTSRLVANNTGDDVEIVTLDLSPEEIAVLDPEGLNTTEKDENDDFLRHKYQELGAFFLNDLDEATQGRVTRILCDSTKLDLGEHGLRNRFDLIFVDGGHHYDIIKSDSDLAFEMLKPSGVIVWHDYASGIHTDVARFLDEQSEAWGLYHIKNTMMAICARGEAKVRFDDILERSGEA